MTCAERRDAIFLLAADQLASDEGGELRAHLDAGCPRCLGALSEADAALARLALDLEPMEPPRAVREQLGARALGEASAAIAPAARTSTRPAWRRTALAAGVAALAAFGAGRLSTPSDDSGLASELDRSRAVLGVLVSPDVSLIDLSGGALDFRGVARMYWDQSGGCYLRATAMRQPEAGRSYVLWFTDVNGAPLRGGVLEVGENGEATLLTEMPAGIDPTASVYVTQEPDPSVSAPTAEPVLRDLLDQT